MSFADGLWLALERAALVALAAVGLGSAVAHLLRAGAPSRKGGAYAADASGSSASLKVQAPPFRVGAPLIVVMLALVWLTPTLLVGYTYSDGPLSLARHAAWNEVLYSTLLAMKLLPVAVAVLRLAPSPPLSREGAFLRTLAPATSELGARRLRHALSFQLYGTGRHTVLAFAVVLLLAFQDFELAALLNVAAGRAHSAFTWTIALHEARQLSAPMGDILSRVAWVLLVQFIILGGAAALLWQTRAGTSDSHHHRSAPSRTCTALAWTSTAAAFTAICAVPGFIVLRGAAEGLGELLKSFRFGDELLSSLYFAVGATALVMVLVNAAGAPRRQAGAGRTTSRIESGGKVTDQNEPRERAGSTALPGRCSMRTLLTALLCIPGLLGALVLGMLLMSVFQLPILRGLYDTPVPLILGLALLALPVALLIHWFLRSNEPREAIHLARMLRQSPDTRQRSTGRSLLWSLRGRSWLFLAAFVFFFAYLELVVSVTLAPIAMTPAVVELYNQMHYGQRSLLSALMAVTMAVPVIVMIVWLVLAMNPLSPRERTDYKRRAAAF